MRHLLKDEGRLRFRLQQHFISLGQVAVSGHSRSKRRQQKKTEAALRYYSSSDRLSISASLRVSLYSILTLDLTGLAPAPIARSTCTWNCYILTVTGTFYSLTLETGLLYQTPRRSTNVSYVTPTKLLSAFRYFRLTGPKHEIGLSQNRPPTPTTASKSNFKTLKSKN